MPKNGKIAVINADREDAATIKETLEDSYEIIFGDSTTLDASAIEKEKPEVLILGMRPRDHTSNVLLDILSAKGIEIPTLVITTTDLITDNLAQKGIAGLLLKPIDKKRLAAHVNAIFDIQRSTAAKPAPAPTAGKEDTTAPSHTPPAQEPTEDTAEDTEIGERDKPLILVVDDEPDMQSLLKDLLEFSGFDAITASDGVEGLKQAQSRRPNVILLDIMLPKLDGFQMCRLLKFNDKYRSIPIIMLTARNHPKDRELADGSGANSYIVKPFESPDLLAEINKLIEKPEE